MYHISRTEILLFIGGVVGVYVISSAANSAVERAAAGVERATRERIWRRELRLLWYWRGPDLLGIVLMCLGVLQNLGLLRLLPHGWGVPVLAAGLTVLSLSSSLRTWLSSRAYSAEAHGSAAARSAFRAALIVTAAELLLAGAVCWYVLSRSPAAAAPAGTSTQGPTVTVPGKTHEEGNPFWVDEAEALRMLQGKDAAYLDALVRRQDVRAKVEDGRKLYRRDDISSSKTAGLPTMEELQEDLKAKDK
ncbi:MAG: hypothetical protein ABSE73_04985 [Planctomycetota bacterium]